MTVPRKHHITEPYETAPYGKAPADTRQDGDEHKRSEAQDGPPQDSERTLHVLIPAGSATAIWDELISDVARALELDPLLEQLDEVFSSNDTAFAGSILDIASRTAKPVLLLPLSAPHADAANGTMAADAASGSQAPSALIALKRAVIPIDATGMVSTGAVEMAKAFHAIGSDTVLLHVIDEHTRPRIWEGAGHYVEAWWEELSTRHRGIPSRTRLDTAVGKASALIRDHLAQGDLLVTLWNCDSSPNRAMILRELVGGLFASEGLSVPVLFYPLSPIA
ncbi:MAG: hypothetical protein M1399_09590 [Actinobacteria bacterium]|nr:hypothetical protein [Actinomycetota bacterium]MCL5447369.1 hypothetical protein [Actinomycetota bacterium]